MHIIRAVIAILLLHYAVYWSFPKPVDLATAVVRVNGGELRSIAISSDGRSGEIDIDAPRDCLAVEWTIQSKSGLTFRGSHAWTSDCLHTWLPVIK